DVVSLVETTNNTRVAAYASATSHVRRRQTCRDSGRKMNNASAAIPERKPATCQSESEHPLMAAPPVENRKAARKRKSRLRVNLQSRTIQYRSLPFEFAGYCSERRDCGNIDDTIGAEPSTNSVQTLGLSDSTPERKEG